MFHFLVGLAALVLGAELLVRGASKLALSMGVSSLVVGLTVVSFRTSAPELAASVQSAWSGQVDIALGNVVGSNMFNILAVLGISASVAPSELSMALAILTFDLPIMVAVAVACLPVFFTEARIARWEGALFLALYVAYTLYLVFDATSHDALDRYGAVMGSFVLPMLVVTLLVLAWRQWQAGRGQKP